MSNKDLPIAKKKIITLMQQFSPIERLQILEPLCEAYRNESRKEVNQDIREFCRRKNIKLIKTDY